MPKPIQLHPKVRERKTPRVAAAALAEFIISPPDRQDDLLHDQRFSSAYVAPKYGDALRAIEAYCADRHRPKAVLSDAKSALEKKAVSAAFTPSQKEEAKRCAEVIDLFGLAANGFGADGLQLMKAADLAQMKINGLQVSVSPNLLVGRAFPPEKDEKVGMIFIRPQKRPDPDGCKTEAKRLERQEYRREVMRYMLVLGWMALRETGVAESQIDTKKMAGWDLRLGGEAIPFPSDRVSRIKRIEAACGQIARLWETIATKPSDVI